MGEERAAIGASLTRTIVTRHANFHPPRVATAAVSCVISLFLLLKSDHLLRRKVYDLFAPILAAVLFSFFELAHGAWNWISVGAVGRTFLRELFVVVSIMHIVASLTTMASLVILLRHRRYYRYKHE